MPCQVMSCHVPPGTLPDVQHKIQESLSTLKDRILSWAPAALTPQSSLAAASVSRQLNRHVRIYKYKNKHVHVQLNIEVMYMSDGLESKLPWRVQNLLRPVAQPHPPISVLACRPLPKLSQPSKFIADSILLKYVENFKDFKSCWCFPSLPPQPVHQPKPSSPKVVDSRGLGYFMASGPFTLSAGTCAKLA